MNDQRKNVNDVIDVKYKEIVELEDKTTEILTAETNTIWNQMEMIGNIGIQLAIEAGARLKIIKGRLGHGEWESWANKNLEFSIRKAKNMMRLATKAEDENSLFSNRQTFADIGISKVYALLGTSEEVAEEVINEPGIDEISVRKLQEKIKLLEKEKAEAVTEYENVEREKSTWKEKEAELVNGKAEAELEAARLQTEIDELFEKQLQELQRPEVDEEKINELEKAITEKEDLIEEAEEKLKEIEERLEKAESDKKAEIEEAVREATRAAEAEHESEIKKLKEKHATDSEEQEAEIKKLKEAAKKNSDTDLIEFKIKSDILQTDFNDCLKAITAVEVADSEQASKMKLALKKVMEALESRI